MQCKEYVSEMKIDCALQLYNNFRLAFATATMIGAG